MQRIGIIGCGVIAHTHVKAYEYVGEAEVIACCDIDEQKGLDFAKKYNCHFSKNYLELLENPNIDIVSICTPHHLHKEMTLAALEKQKHVLCEKPMGLSSEDAHEIIDAVKKSRKEYAVCYQNRFNDSSLLLKELLNTEDFGLLKGIKCSVTWHREKDYYLDSTWRGSLEKEGGGVLINQAIHTFDLICWLISPPQKIKGKIMTALLDGFIEVEDSAMGTAVIDNSIPISIYATNTYSSDPAPEIYFEFEKALIKLTMDKLICNNDVLFSKEATNCKVGKSYWGNGHLKMIEAFIHQIVGIPNENTKFLAITDSVNSLKMVEGIYLSDKYNQWTHL